MSEADKIWHQTIMPESSNIQNVISNLNQVALRIVLVVNEAQKLVGTISDGDIRRGLLKGLNLNSPITSVINRNPLVVPPDIARDTVMQLMGINKIQQIPVVNADHQLVGLHLWDEIFKPAGRTNLMVIMAGGKGTRLLPYTENCPKPMVCVAGKPMLEHIIERAKLEGFSQFVLAIHHLGAMIEEYFGDGTRLGVEIEYLREQFPLGTAGALGLMKRRPSAPFIVTNADVITDIRYGELLDFHLRHEATATMAVRLHEWQHPFGVVKTRGVEIVGLEEKPVARSHINAGVYALSPDALDELLSERACDMPSLFERLRARSKRTVAYPMHEPWLDVGSPHDLAKANSVTV
ncbi:nucleotidyltransferase family protein [Burkholderiaceae bacterium]|nr:nucleotidyltransferase family protein [Burkholderiaceae bacterium]